MQSSGFAKPLVGVVVLLTMITTLGSMALPVLAREASGSAFIEVQPGDVRPEAAPSDLAFTAPDPTVPGDPFDGIDDPDSDDEAAPAEEIEPVEEPEEEADSDEEEEAAPEDEPANDLTDIPEYPLPGGFETLQTWNDGDNVRGTIYAASNGDEAALVAYISADRGGWTGVDIDEVNGVDSTRQWLYEHADHPFCLWIEYYDKGIEREDLELETGLVGPQFMVIETPFCEPFPDPYA